MRAASLADGTLCRASTIDLRMSCSKPGYGDYHFRVIAGFGPGRDGVAVFPDDVVR